MILLFILSLLIVAAATAAFVRSEPKPVRIQRPPLPEHIRRHHAAQDRGDFNR